MSTVHANRLSRSARQMVVCLRRPKSRTWIIAAGALWLLAPEAAAQVCCELTGGCTPNTVGCASNRFGLVVSDCSACSNQVGACCIPESRECFLQGPSGPLGQSAAFNCSVRDGQYKGDGTTCVDSDGDGLPDVAENNDCVFGFLDRCNTGSDPNNPDTDGDGVNDGDELTRGTSPCVPDPPSPLCQNCVVGSIGFEQAVVDRFVPADCVREGGFHIKVYEANSGETRIRVSIRATAMFADVVVIVWDGNCQELTRALCEKGLQVPCLPDVSLPPGARIGITSTLPNFPEQFEVTISVLNLLGVNCCRETNPGEFECVERDATDCAILGGEVVDDCQDCPPPSALVACCLPEGGCSELLLSDCQEQGGQRVPSCLGDLNFNGRDDACPVACCLGDGRCEVLPDGECADSFGMPVDACLGDENDDGRDDACGVPCCRVLPATCSIVPLNDCVHFRGNQRVSECLGDLDGNGRDDVCVTDCCLPDGICVEVADSECAASGGTAIDLCHGDDRDRDGVDDACPVACCLPDGSCDVMPEFDCSFPLSGPGGTQVDACLGDQDDDGRDDACPVPCCFSDIGLCLSISAPACAEGFGVEVPECLGDLNENGTNDACPVACCLPDGACLAMPDGDCSTVGTAVLFCEGDQDNDGRDDACEGERISCCLAEGLFCLEATESDCEAGGGRRVPACLGDQDGDGREDACGPTFDSDGDGDVDLSDYLVFLPCIGAAALPPPPGCELFDFDGDGDVDLSDAIAFWGAFTGSR